MSITLYTCFDLFKKNLFSFIRFLCFHYCCRCAVCNLNFFFVSLQVHAINFLLLFKSIFLSNFTSIKNVHMITIPFYLYFQFQRSATHQYVMTIIFFILSILIGLLDFSFTNFFSPCKITKVTAAAKKIATKNLQHERLCRYYCVNHCFLDVLS